jgi:hypothetical protein
VHLYAPPFSEKLRLANDDFKRRAVDVLQVNLGRHCNLANRLKKIVGRIYGLRLVCALPSETRRKAVD